MKESNASKIYKAVGAEAVLTEASDLRKYLTGFSTSFGYVLSDKDGNVFYTDSRYLEGAKNALTGTDIAVRQYEAPLENIIKNYKQIAIPLDKTFYPVYEKLKNAGHEIVDSLPAFVSAMAVKGASEKENIKKACEIADKSFVGLLPLIKEGMSENEVAAHLEFLMRTNGASGTSFDTIVAFGENSSVPHHETGDRKLKFGDIVLIDFGCKYNGYCSDCTRTFLFGDDGKHEEFKEVYGRVLTAHMLVKQKATDGMTGLQVDAFARDFLKEYGLDKLFTHSLGHGIGINIHEFPFISPKGQDKLKNGMVFSDEPGVYLEGKFGIRIEDTVMREDGKIISLTDSDKKLLIL